MCLFKHNENAYKEMAQYLDTKNRALLVLGTSGGKTTTALEYVHQNNGRALVLCPTNGIKIDWEAKDVCDAYTYQAFSFNDFYKTIDYSKYCVIILDESHHVGYDEKTDTGAKSWSKSVKWILDNNKCKVLGLTATNERTDGIDLAKTFFDGCTVYGLAVEDMIEQGILYPFSYVTAIYNYHEIMSKFTDLRSTGDETTKGLLGQLDLSINNTKTVNTILNEYTKKQGIHKIKGIVFVSPNKNEEKNTINEAKSIILNSFPNMKNKVRVLYSDDSYMKNEGNTCEENKEWFEKTDEGIIITINKAGEGWHPKGINVLVMFRKTSSYLVFTQQLGRIMMLKTQDSVDPHAIVFDLVNNIENIEYSNIDLNEKEIKERPIYKIVRALQKINSNQIIIADETRDIVECIKKIKEYYDEIWEEWENEILMTYFKNEGLKGCQKRIDEEWLKRFPNSLKENGHHRSDYSINGQSFRLGLKEKKKRQIICIETQQIFESISDAHKKGLNFDNSVLKSKDARNKDGYHLAYLDDVKKQEALKEFVGKQPKVYRWNETLDSILKDNYEKMTIAEIKINYPELKDKDLVARAKKLGLSKNKSLNWTPKEDQIIIENYSCLGGEIIKLLPERNLSQIRARAKILGVSAKDYQKGKLVFNNGVKQIYILENEIPYWSDLGYVRGMLPRKNK